VRAAGRARRPRRWTILNMRPSRLHAAA
jgi:hypothetical protein